MSNSASAIDPNDPGLIAGFGFDEQSGSPASLVGGYTMTLAGAPSRVAPGGNFGTRHPLAWGGRALSFNGSSQYGTVAGLLDTPPAGGAIAGWFKPGVAMPISTQPRLFSKFSLLASIVSGCDCYIDNVAGGGQLTFRLYRTISDISLVKGARRVWIAGRWYHVVISWGTVGIRIFINAAQEAHDRSNLNPAWSAGTENPFYLSALYDGTAHAHGQFTFDDLIVYGYEPSAAQVRAWFRAGLDRQGVVPVRAGEYEKWTRSASNPVILPSLAAEGDVVIEPSAAIEANGSTTLYYTGTSSGGAHVTLRATSADGETGWTKAGTVLGHGTGGESGDANCNNVRDFGGTRHLYYANGYGPTGGHFNLATSADGGATFAKYGKLIDAAARSDYTTWANSDIVFWRGQYYLLLEGKGAIDTLWRITLWTAPAPTGPFTFVQTLWGLQVGDGGFGGPNLHQVGALWHVWYHYFDESATLPTMIKRAVSADLLNWVQVPGPAVDLDDFASIAAQDQVADPFPIVVPAGGVRLYCDIDSNPPSTSFGRICLLKFPGSIEQLMKDDPAGVAATADYGDPTVTVTGASTAGKQAVADALQVAPGGTAAVGSTNNLIANASVVVLPALATLINPGPTLSNIRALYQYSAPSFQWTVVDAAGAAVNLTGKSLQLKVYTDDGTTRTARFTYTTAAGAVTISGTGHNIVTAQFAAANTTTVYPNLRYELQNTTDKLVLAAGSIDMVPAMDMT